MATSRTLPHASFLGLVPDLEPLSCPDEEPTEPVGLRVAASTLEEATREAKHSGVVARVGTHTVEVVAHVSGEIHAYAEGDGSDVAYGEMMLEVHVLGGRRLIDLRRNPDASRYEGRVVNAKLVPGRMTLLCGTGRGLVIVHIPAAPLQPALSEASDTPTRRSMGE